MTKLKIREASCLGAANLAGFGAGVYKDPFQARDIIQIDVTYYLQEKMHERYHQKYCVYQGIYDSIKKITPQLLI